MSEENKLKKTLDLICSWVGCVDNEFSCSIKDSENLYKDEEQVITYINNLFTENKRLREALEKIASQTVKTQDTLCNLKLDSCTNDCKSCFQNIAKQALGE